MTEWSRSYIVLALELFYTESCKSLSQENNFSNSSHRNEGLKVKLNLKVLLPARVGHQSLIPILKKIREENERQMGLHLILLELVDYLADPIKGFDFCQILSICYKTN